MVLTKVYVAGCGGMLGSALYQILVKNNVVVFATDIDVNEEWLQFGDVRDYFNIKQQIRNFSPDAIVNLAALTDLEYCEAHSNDAWLTNAMGSENLCNIAREFKKPYVYISTAGIFDGRQDIYTDFDRPNPLGYYAKAKLYGEEHALRYHKSYVFRAGWMMGGLDKDKKFIMKIVRQILGGNTELNVVSDKLGTPTYTYDFAKSIYTNLLYDLPFGLYNMVCEGECSRYDVAYELVRLLGKDISINKVSTDFWKNEYFAIRPASEKLLNLKLNAIGLIRMRNWKECLAEYVNQIKDCYEI